MKKFKSLNDNTRIILYEKYLILIQNNVEKRYSYSIENGRIRILY